MKMNDHKIGSLIKPLIAVAFMASLLLVGCTKKEETVAFSPLITQKEHQILVSRFAEISDLYFKGQLSMEERDAAINNLVKSLNKKGDIKKRAHLQEAMRMQSAYLSAFHILPLLLKKAYAVPVTKKEKKLLSGLDLRGMSADMYLNTQVKFIMPYVKTLKKHGIRFNKHSKWKLGSRKKISPTLLKNEPSLYLAISILISPKLANMLADDALIDAPIIFNNVYYPPSTQRLPAKK